MITNLIFQKTDMECPICFDLAETTYCDTVICLKCKFFFQGVMRGRILLSLRCSKFGNCSTKNDITCQKCRFERCRLANMVDKYCYTELTVSMLKTQANHLLAVTICQTILALVNSK